MTKGKNLVIITGSSGSGKSTIIKYLFKDYSKISVNSIKENIFNKYYEEKEILNGASKKDITNKTLNIFWNNLEGEMKNNKNCIIEYPFGKWSENKFNKLISKYKYNVILVIVYVSNYNLIKRRISRIENGERHKGHYDFMGKDKYLEYLKDKLKKSNKIEDIKTKKKYIKKYNLDLKNKKIIIYDNNRAFK